MELQVCQTSSLCYSGLYNLTVIPRPRGQKYLSRNNFFIYSLIQIRSSIKMPLIIFQSFLFFMKYSRFINISESEFLKESQSRWACKAMIQMAELMTALFLFLQYLPINGIFSTTLNNSLSMFIEQNNICIVQLFLKVKLLLSLQASFDVQHLMMKRQYGSRNLVLIHQSLLIRAFRCSQIRSKQFLLQISKRLAMDIILIILKWFDVLLSIALANFLPLVSFSSLRSFQGGTLASTKFSRVRYLSSSVSKSFIKTFIRQMLLQLSRLQIRILSGRQRYSVNIKD